MEHIHGDNSPSQHVYDTTMMMDHTSNTNMVHNMIMYFHVGYKETILFKFWQTTNVGTFILSCFILFVISLLYEGLKLLRHKLGKIQFKEKRDNHGDDYNCFRSSSSLNIQKDLSNKQSKNKIVELLNGIRIMQAFLYMIQAFISYALMLVFMTFNIWLSLSIILGAGFGHLLFGYNRSNDENDEHCI